MDAAAFNRAKRKINEINDNNILGKKINWELGSINLVTNINSSSNARIRAINQVYFLAGESINTKNSEYLVGGILLDGAGNFISNFNFTDEYVFTQDAYARFTIKNGTADEDFTTKVDAISYFLNYTPPENKGKIFNWELGSITLTTNVNSVSSLRIRTTSPVYFVAGESVNTKDSDYLVAGILLDSAGNFVANFGYADNYTFTQNAYARFVIKNGTIDEDFTSLVNTVSKNFKVVQKTVFTQKENKWRGKSWYAFGTSMTDTNTKGKYPQVVDRLSGLIRTNMAIGGGGICPTASHGGNVKANVLACPYDVDLTTLEAGLNDWGSVDLGTIGDTSDNTFIGNFTQCLEYLTTNTRSRVVVILMIATTYELDGITRRSPFYTNTFSHLYSDYIDAMKKVAAMYGVPTIDIFGECMGGGRKNHDTILDTIHLTDLGGKIVGEFVWDKLKNINPMPHMPSGI